MNIFKNNAENNMADQEIYELNYDKFIPLDAENLAEGGIEESYNEISEIIHKDYGIKLKKMTQIFCEDRYIVNLDSKSFVVYEKVQLENDDIWRLATIVFFSIINIQLSALDIKLYAINGGNDLGGMFLTNEQVRKAKKSLALESDWPYLPN